jgi:peptidoglycan hydrolase-like protein with peptidoglycan-binding domain
VAAHPTISRGSRGDAVKLAQTRLHDRYYDPGPRDGIFGPKTLKAVKFYQGDRPLQVDGVVGPRTWRRLDPPTIRTGAKGDAVRLLQHLLDDYLYDPGPIDGDFGPKTEHAVKEFQKDFSLEVDGIVGRRTWAGLGS